MDAEHPLSRWDCWKGVGEVGKGQMEDRRKFTSHSECQKSRPRSQREGFSMNYGALRGGGRDEE